MPIKKISTKQSMLGRLHVEAIEMLAICLVRNQRKCEPVEFFNNDKVSSKDSWIKILVHGFMVCRLSSDAIGTEMKTGPRIYLFHILVLLSNKRRKTLHLPLK